MQRSGIRRTVSQCEHNLGFRLHGVTLPVMIYIEHVGHEADFFGSYRRDFVWRTSFALNDYRIHYALGLASHEVELLLSNTSIRK